MTDNDTDKKDKKSKYSLSERLSKFAVIKPYESQQTFQKPVNPDADDAAADTETFEKLEFKTIRSKIDPQSDDEQVKKLEKEYKKFVDKNDELKAFGCLEKILLLEPNSYFGFLREGDIFHQLKNYRVLHQ